LAESSLDLGAVREAYPGRLDDIDLFDAMGLLTPRTLLGHAVMLRHEQRKQVAAAGSSVVHCPTANLFLESGLMDYRAHRAAGIHMALGSSVAGGPDPFMPRVAVQCLQTAKAVKVHAIPRGSHEVPRPAEAWWLLTRGAAEALSMAGRIGSIEPGFEADCLVVRPEKWIADLEPAQQISALLYTIRPEHIEHVFVAGRRVGPDSTR
jgi:guanine deaminase